MKTRNLNFVPTTDGVVETEADSAADWAAAARRNSIALSSTKAPKMRRKMREIDYDRLGGAKFRLKALLVQGLGALALAGCTGSIEGFGADDTSNGPSDTPPDDTSNTPPSDTSKPPPGVSGDGLIESPEDVIDSATCQAPQPGRAPLRRLSNAEYRNTLGDLLGDSSLADQAVATFIPENESLGFRNSADILVVTSLLAQQYMDSAEDLAASVSSNPDFNTCNTAADKRECATDFIRDFGERTYRRPLTTAEVQRYLELYDTALPHGDVSTGIEWIAFTMLQSPNFLYRVELGQPAAKAGLPPSPSPYEMAARLSYLFWQSAPDASLLSAAAQGKLGTKSEIEAQARRMLEDPKADRVYEFFDQWLDVDRIASMQRDQTVFPDLDSDLPELFRGETKSFVLDLLHSSSGTLSDLFTAPYTYANARLAEHYGLSGPTTNAFERVERPDSVGFFSQGGFIAAHDKPTRSSIVLRGLKMRTDLLCQLVGAPPNNVQVKIDELDPNLTQRERLQQHRQDPTCNSCHELMDPLGLVFEGYDAVGRSRTTDEAGNPVDTNSVISKTKDLNGAVSGPAELAAKMAGSEEVRQCYTRQAFRFFYGRETEAADVCSRAELSQAFRDSNYNLGELLVALTQTDAFLYRPEIKPATD